LDAVPDGTIGGTDEMFDDEHFKSRGQRIEYEDSEGNLVLWRAPTDWLVANIFAVRDTFAAIGAPYG
jgi:hypothetical protein